MTDIHPAITQLRYVLETVRCSCGVDDADILAELQDSVQDLLNSLPEILAAAWDRGYRAAAADMNTTDQTPNPHRQILADELVRLGQEIRPYD